MATVWPGAPARRGVIVGDPDPPAAVRRRAGDGDVPAQADQHAAAQAAGDQLRAPVGGPGLGRGAEVELGAAAAAEPAGRPGPAGRCASRAPADRPGRRRPAVPAAGPRRSRGRSPGRPGRAAQVGSTSPPVSRAARSAAAMSSANTGLTGRGAPRGLVQRGELGVGAEPAGGPVDGGQLAVGDGPGRASAAASVTSRTAVVPNTPKLASATAATVMTRPRSPGPRPGTGAGGWPGRRSARRRWPAGPCLASAWCPNATAMTAEQTTPAAPARQVIRRTRRDALVRAGPRRRAGRARAWRRLPALAPAVCPYFLPQWAPRPGRCTFGTCTDTRRTRTLT